jgi:hypothetical protein
MGIFISSSLPERHRAQLEELFFFNPGQRKMRTAIERSISQYGTPQITETGGRVRLTLPAIPDAQTFYIYPDEGAEELIGIALCIRKAQFFHVLFWGIKASHSFSMNPRAYVLLEIVQNLRSIAKRIVGIEYLSFDVGSTRQVLRV